MDQPLLVLLLPHRLERFHLGGAARDLLELPGTVAVDPARLPRRMPAGLAAGLAVGQAKRMRLPGVPAAVAIFHPAQYYLAGALLSRHPEAELWYGEADDDDPRLAPQREAAARRAALRFPAGETLHLAPLRDRMAELGIGTGLSGPPSAPAA